MNETQAKEVFPRWWLLLGLTAVGVYASSALIAFRHWTTNIEHATYVCLLYGGLLFLPLCSGVIFVQIILRRLTNEILKSRQGLRLVVLLAPPVLLMFFAVDHAHISQRDRELAFQKFFSFTSPSVKVLAYGYERTALGDGSYVFIFEIPKDELRSLLKAEGYQTVSIESQPENWRLDICNDLLHELTRTTFRIFPDYECYGKNASATASRIFYNQGQQEAIFVGLGRY